jgi:predicted glycosyltransferase
VKIIIYCQHVLGVGHFFRTLEIAKAMKSFDVILITGGGKVDVTLPVHVRQIELPGLMMDENFSHLYSIDPAKTLETVKYEREKLLLDLIKNENPDLFLIELYPFGRRAFRFELNPVLDFIKDNLRKCKVVCSLRDILVEKENKAKYEQRVCSALNRWFDTVLVHSDPQLIQLDSTFSQLDKIKIPIVYTGFVTPVPEPEKVKKIRKKRVSGQDEYLITASAGGGNVGAPLLKAVVQAFNTLSLKKNARLNVFTGPYMDDHDKKYLYSFSDSRIRVEEFADNFVSLLSASDLSISMAGYNTCMNIVAAKVPSLVWPFVQNREQRQRAQKIAQFVPMTILEDSDLAIPLLTQLIEKNLARHRDKVIVKDFKLNINGAVNTANWIGNKL